MISLVCWWVAVQASQEYSVSAADNVLCCNILMSRRAGTLQFLAAMSRVGAGAQCAVLEDGWQRSRVHLVKIHQVLQAGKLGLGPVQRKSIFARVRNPNYLGVDNLVV